MVVNTVGHLAEAAWHHPDITASYAWVEVRLMTHPPRASPARIWRWQRRSRTSCTGSPARKRASWKARRIRHALRLHQIRLIGEARHLLTGRRITSGALHRASEPDATPLPTGVRLHRRAWLQHRRQGGQYRARHRAADRGRRHAARRAIQRLSHAAVGQHRAGLVRQRLHRRSQRSFGRTTSWRAAKASSE